MKDKVDCGARPFGVEAAEANRGRLPTVDFLGQSHSQLQTTVTTVPGFDSCFPDGTIVRHVGYQCISFCLHIIVPNGIALVKVKTH